MLAKQADTVMLFYLFSHEQLRHLFERLGYEFGPETARKNIDYYDARTSHGSTLSFVTHRMCWSSPWTMSTSTRWPKGRWLRGAPDRRRTRSTRGNSHGRPAHRRRPGGL